MLGVLKSIFGVKNDIESSINKQDLGVLFEKEVFHKYMFPIAYDENTGFYFLDDGYVGLIFLLSPLIFAGEDAYKVLWSNLYKDPMLPEGSILQWTVYGNPYIEPFIDKWEFQKEKSQYFDFVKKYKEFLLQKRDEGFYQDWLTPVRKFMLFFTVKIPMDDFDNLEREREFYTSYKASVESTLKIIGLHPFLIEPKELIFYYRQIFHPNKSYYDILQSTHYSDEEPIKTQIFDNDFYIKQGEGYFEMCEHYGRTLSIRKGSYGFPKEINFQDVLEFFGAINHRNIHQINSPFLISFVAQKVNSQEKDKLRLKAETYLKQKSFSALAIKLEERITDIVDFVRRMDNGDEVYKGMYYFYIYGKDFNRVKASAKVIKEMVTQKGFILQEESYPLTWAMATIPFQATGEHFESRWERDQIMLGENAAFLTPIAIDWFGTETPTIPLVTRRGNLLFVDLYDSDGSYSAGIFASSGSGKSFLTNHIIFNYRTKPDTILRIIDVGGSYEALCDLFDGTFVDFSVDAGIILNPFWGLETEEQLKSTLPYLTSVILLMARISESVKDHERGFISQAIMDAWNKHGSRLTLDAIHNELVRIAKERDDEELLRFAELNLVDWCKGGPYAHLFNQPPNVDLSDRVVVFEMKGTTGDARLMRVALASFFLLVVLRDMYDPEKRHYKKIIVWDEFHRFVDAEEIVNFAVRGVKEVRKENGSFVIITQNLGDLFNTTYAGKLKNMFANLEYLFLLKQPAEEWERMVKEGMIDLSDWEKEFLKTTLYTVKGKYSEAYVISRSGRGRYVTRLTVDKFFKWLYTTDPEELSVRKFFKKNSSNITEAIEKCIQWENAGKHYRITYDEDGKEIRVPVFER